MSGPDRRHAVAVGRKVAITHDEPWAIAAGLLHDVGKVDSQLSTIARVLATVAGLAARERAISGDGRVARYLRHDGIGADLLTAAGSDERTVAWAREHHLPPERWTVPRGTGDALKAADDD
ncbi:MAG TPA: HD domain-containing protein [Acidimicrobiales bacterium]|nr:HD domain-containing protein [Acidimicrobiales bacterium]